MADLAMIEKALDDINNNMATKSEVAELIKSEMEKDEAESKALAEGNEKALKKAQDDLAAQQTTVKDLAEQVKYLRATRYESIKGPDGDYRGVWPNAETAKNFGLWVMADVLGSEDARKQCDAVGITRRAIIGNEVKALDAGEIAAGAALAPSGFIPRLIELIESYSAYRQLAQEYPLGAGDNSVPVQTSDPTVYCPGAGVAPTAGDIGFKNVGLNPLEWASYVAVNRDLDEDTAISLGELVGRSLARAFGNKEDNCGFIGDGTSIYFNIHGARAALRAVDATVGNVKGLHVQDTAGAWSSIDLQDLLAVAGLLPDYAEIGNDIAWVCSKAFYMTVMINAALTAGGAYAAEVTRPDYLKNPTYLGRPVKFGGGMPKVKAAADHCPLLYGNWKLGAALGDRRKLTVEQSTEVKFLERQRVIMGTERISINNHGVGDTTSAGPICGLWADIS